MRRASKSHKKTEIWKRDVACYRQFSWWNQENANIATSGLLTKYLEDLENCGFIRKYQAIGSKTKNSYSMNNIHSKLTANDLFVDA